MSKKHDKSQGPSDLRNRAEARLARGGDCAPEMSPEQVQILFHDLQTHQIELEMQNEELRGAQKELLASRDRYSDLYDFAPVGYVTVSDKGLIVEANLALADMFGVDRRLLMNRPLSIFVLPEDQNVYYKHSRALFKMKTRDKDACQLRMRRSGGAPFWAQMKSVLVPAPEGGGDQLRCVISDITDRKHAEQELQSTVADLAQSNEELEAYAYTISHDLKSPLITIAGLLGLLRKHVEKGNMEKVDEDMARISSAADKMKLLLDQLLELSRVGRVAGSHEAVSLEDLAREAVELVAGRIAERAVRVEIAPGLPVLRGERPQLLQILMNLIGNAVKFVGEQAEPRIEIGVRQDGDATVCYVRDNGAGIEPQHKDRIFGLFHQLDPQAGGTGLGLTLVKRIVEAHGGRVWAESEGLGKGSTFCFTAPGPRKRTRGEKRNERQSDGCLVG